MRLNLLALIPVFITALTFSVSELARAEDSIRLCAAGPNAIANLQKMKPDLEKASGAKVEATMNPADTGMMGWQKGLFDGFLGPSMEEAWPQAEKRGMPKQKEEDYLSTEFTTRRIKLAVHPDNPVKELTRDQITQILSNQIKTWEPINGKKTPITIIMTGNYPGSITKLIQFYIKKDKLPESKTVLDRDGQVRAMKTDPGSIAIFMQPYKTADFEPKFLNTEATYSTYFTVRKNARPGVIKIFEYMKNRPNKMED